MAPAEPSRTSLRHRLQRVTHDAGMLVVLSVVIACTLSADLAAAERTNKGRPDGAVDAAMRVRAQDGIGRWTIRGRAAPRDTVGLHELPGRPLLVRSGQKKSQVLERAGAAQGGRALRRDGGVRRGKAKAVVRQYLVRVENPVPAGLADYLRELSGGRFFRYLPHDTFVMALAESAIQKARQRQGVVDVFEFPASMKMEPDLLTHISAVGASHAPPTGQPQRTLKRTSEDAPFVVQVMLAYGGSSWASEAKALVTGWRAAIAAKGLAAEIVLASEHKVVVSVDGVHMLKKVTDWLVRQPLVHWVQERREITLRNKHGSKAVQSWNASTHEIWDRGIDGSGQIVGVADTGIDYDNCFFRDSTMPTPAMCTGSNPPATFINHNHRKIVTYRSFSGSDDLDYYGGHGTHVAGSVAGSAQSSVSAEQNFASQYDGSAPGAKLAFDDIGDSQGWLTGIPDDLNSDLFPHPYAAGARIHSNSWGSTAGYYDMMSMEIDEFTHSHDDFLVLVAAGNDGPDSFSVGAPATAKNILSVGATENAGGMGSTSYEMNVAYSNGANALQCGITPASFGPDVTAMAEITSELRLAFPLDGCTDITSDVSGKIALVQRGTCNFDVKVLNAQNKGAIAVVVYNNVVGPDVSMGAANYGGLITIPAVFISLSDGSALKADQDSGNNLIAKIPILNHGDPALTHHQIASFSSRGPTDELRLKPDVLCPGVQIHSAHSDGLTTSNNCGTEINSQAGAVATMSGTSMATPLCAGAAALVRQYFQDGFSAHGERDAMHAINASAALVKAVMIHSAQPVKVSGSAYEDSYPSPNSGYGHVDLSSALFFADSPYKTLYKSREKIELQGQQMLYCFTVDAGHEFRVSMVWTDPPGTPTSWKPLINDLDLVVYGPNNTFMSGNSLRQTDETHGTYVVRDSVNNAEQVRVAAPIAGMYAVRVLGTDLPATGNDGQTFSLVVSAKGLEQISAASCSELRCPNNCSGNGVCLSTNICSCDLLFGGLDCSKAHKELFPVADPRQTTLLSVTWLGMSYYFFTIPENESFNITFSPDSSQGSFDADFLIARGRLPSFDDNDAVIADQYSAGTFRSVGNGAGTWIVGLSAYQGNARVNAVLQSSFTSEDDGDVDGGGGGGSSGGGGEGGGNCTSPCQCGRFTTTQGAFSDGSGGDYSNNANCWWILAPATSDLVNLTLVFTYLDVEESYDFVEFWECHDPWCESKSFLQQVSGYRPAGYRVESSSGFMLVTFTSDESVTEAGFQASWMINQAPPPGSSPPASTPSPTPEAYNCSTGPCNCAYHTALHGVFSDGSGNGTMYRDETSCRWVIDAATWTTDKKVVELNFPTFSTELGYDFVTINECQSLTWRDSSGQGLAVPICLQPMTIAQLSGDDFLLEDEIQSRPLHNARFSSLSGIMEVKFESDYMITDLGFVASWKPGDFGSRVCTSPCQCGLVSGVEGMLEDGSKTERYQNDASCEWTIAPSGATWITLLVEDFRLEQGYDYVLVYECDLASNSWSQPCSDPASRHLLDRMTGSVAKDTKIMAKTGAIFVQFVSDESITETGFKVRWTSDGEDGGNACAIGEWPSRPTDAWALCALPGDWQRLKPDGYSHNLEVGGLGLKADDHFHTWVCHYSHHCARRRLNQTLTFAPGLNAATTAKECFEGCKAAGYECGLDVDLLDQYGGCCKEFSCLQTCMMRVAGVSNDTCAHEVNKAASTVIDASNCEVSIQGRRYNLCGDLDSGSCVTAPTVASGLYGCALGAKPMKGQIDPFCWVYNERCDQFEPYGHGSVTGLISSSAAVQP